MMKRTFKTTRIKKRFMATRTGKPIVTRKKVKKNDKTGNDEVKMKEEKKKVIDNKNNNDDDNKDDSKDDSKEDIKDVVVFIIF